MNQGLNDKAPADDINAIGGGPLDIVNGGTGQATKITAFDALAPTGVKGDVIVHNGTNWVKIAVGPNGQIFEADSAEALGVKWAVPAVPIFGQGYEFAESDGLSTTTSATYINKLSLVTAALAAGDYLLNYCAEINQTGITDATGVRFTVAGTPINEIEREAKDTNDFMAISGFRQMNLSGAQTLNIDWRQQRGGTAGIRRARITIWRVA